jgi:hypothetical protein
MGDPTSLGAVAGVARSVTGALTASVALLLAAGLATAATEEVARFADPEIIESSGLIARDGTFITTNDSGDTGRIFVVDQRTGETLEEIGWADDPDDVEALAPATGDTVWVGDIGDNNADRDEVSVALVDLGSTESTTFDLRYPGGAADAEALLSHPQTGQLFVATKSVFGGEFLAAPPALREGKNNKMTVAGRIAGLITDGAFFPDGRHFILRNYSDAFIYAYPTLDLVGEFDLPQQEQGEGLAAADADSVYLSSEGINAPILLVDVPSEITSAMNPPEDVEPGQDQADPAQAQEDPAQASGESPRDQPAIESARPQVWAWVAGVMLALGAAGAWRTKYGRRSRSDPPD